VDTCFHRYDSRKRKIFVILSRAGIHRKCIAIQVAMCGYLFHRYDTVGKGKYLSFLRRQESILRK